MQLLWLLSGLYLFTEKNLCFLKSDLKDTDLEIPAYGFSLISHGFE